MRVHGPFGVRSWALADAEESAAIDAAAELESLGFTALWVRASAVPQRASALLSGTRTVTVASSVNSIWASTPDRLATDVASLTSFGERFVLGLGVSHAPMVERAGAIFDQPLARTRDFLQALDHTEYPVPKAQRIVAALGPAMVRLAAQQSAGAHPYLVTAQYMALMRRSLGRDARLAPGVLVVLDGDDRSAREIGRRHLNQPYLSLPNYVRSLMRQGFSADDIEGGGSDRLVDALVVHGDVATVVARLRSYLDHGADHVAIHLLSSSTDPFVMASWRELAAALA